MSAWQRMQRRGRHYSRERRGRHDVQGLRAVAVLVVIVDHLTGWPGGGFVGVDVFFVISGFLITGLLTREYESSGRVSFVGFYRRRFKRIVPAAAVVLLSTIAVGRFVLFEDRWRAVVVDAGWSAAFAANWRFLAQQTDYFDSSSPVSPLQHFWSLAVEEQFYLVWPIAMLAVLLVAGKAGSRRRTAAPLVLVAVATVASFAYAVQLTSDNLTAAYFSSPARAWELGVGATLALAKPLLQRIPVLLRSPLAWAGLGGILASVVLVESGAGFPAPWALLPVLSTAAVLAAGTRADGLQGRVLPLTNPVSHYVGDISYSLYLWHFPVIILADAWYGHGEGAYYPVVISLIAGLSVASYHLVEDPIRTSPWFEPYTSHSERRRARHAWKQRWAGSYRDLGLVVGALVAAAVVVAGFTRVPPVVADSVDYGQLAETGDSAGRDDDFGLSPVEQALRRDLTEALAADAWPALSPAFDSVEVEGRPSESAECAFVDPADPAQCAFGDPSAPAIAVVGNSLSITLLPTLRAAYGSTHFIKAFPRPACTFSIEMDYPVAGAHQECQRFLDESIAAIAAMRPVLTVVIETYPDLAQARGGDDDEKLDVWRQNKKSIVERLRRTGREVVLLSPPPRGPSVQECASRTSQPADCEYELGDPYQALAEVEESLSGDGVGFIDSSQWFCVDERCPAFVGDILLKRDFVHPTRQWAEKLGPVLKSVLDPWVEDGSVAS